jgi:dephospho-CoA kinase
MEKGRKKPIIGLLGGIGSGKSAVADAFAELGSAVIDADKLAKDLLDKPEYRGKIVANFGPEVLGNNGLIDRAKLAKTVFSDEKKLEALTNIIHPAVLEQTQLLIDAYLKTDTIRAIVLDVPLLAETGFEYRCDVLIFVKTSKDIRLQRAAERGLTPRDLEIRENFQISLDKKESMADYIVNNNSDLTVLAEQVRRIFNRLVR